MFLNISSSMGSCLLVAERIMGLAASVRHDRKSPGGKLHKQRILLTMNAIVLNILGWGRCYYHNWATISKKVPFKGKSFTEETLCQQRKRLLRRKRNTNCQPDDTLP